MEPEQDKEAQRLILESVRIHWTPPLRAVILQYMLTREQSWADACDAVEMSIVIASESIKNAAPQRTGFELAAQAMLLALADLRRYGR